jgi:hypothetical protein
MSLLFVICGCIFVKFVCHSVRVSIFSFLVIEKLALPALSSICSLLADDGTCLTYAQNGAHRNYPFYAASLHWP